MSEQRQSAVCRRCGIGFLVAPGYLDYILRWRARVSVPQLCARCFRKKPGSAECGVGGEREIQFARLKGALICFR
jgi:hypothetical protein